MSRSIDAIVLPHRTRSPGPPHSRLAVIADLLRYYPWQIRLQAQIETHPHPRELILMTGNANWFPQLRRRLCRMPPADRPPVVLWHTEPLPLPKQAPFPRPRLHLREIAKIVLRDARATDIHTNYVCLKHLAARGIPDLLAVSTKPRQEFLAENGISSHWIPLGYHPSQGRDLQLERDIDVLFLGELRIPRRRRLLRRLKRQGIAPLAVGSWSDPAFWGENRTQLLNRTKVFLNIQRYPGEFSGFRLALALANKALVISEPMYDPAPFVPGKHFVSCPIQEMPDVIRYYLCHEQERRAIVEEGHRFVTTGVTMARSVEHLLSLIGEHLNIEPPAK